MAAARQLARTRELAAATRQIEFGAVWAEGKAEGEALALRETIAAICRAFGIPVDDARRAQLATMELGVLRDLSSALLRDRAWPA